MGIGLGGGDMYDGNHDARRADEAEAKVKELERINRNLHSVIHSHQGICDKLYDEKKDLERKLEDAYRLQKLRDKRLNHYREAAREVLKLVGHVAAAPEAPILGHLQTLDRFANPQILRIQPVRPKPPVDDPPF